MNLELVKSESFGQVQCDFYQNEQSDVLMTREQIGRALEYSHPNDAIRNIHDRNRDRLDKLSVSLKLSGTDGKLYDTYAYTYKGVMEICRFSRQAKADAFMDWVWDVIETIRKTGMYAVENHSVKQYLSMSEEDRAILYFQQLKDKRELEQQRLLLAPKAELFDTFMCAKNVQDISSVAKALGTGRNRLYAFLRDHKLLLENNLPYQQYIDRGYFVVREIPVNIKGNIVDKPQTFATPKGIAYIANVLNKGVAV